MKFVNSRVCSKTFDFDCDLFHATFGNLPTGQIPRTEDWHETLFANLGANALGARSVAVADFAQAFKEAGLRHAQANVHQDGLKDNRGKTALDMAREGKYDEAAQLLQARSN